MPRSRQIGRQPSPSLVTARSGDDLPRLRHRGEYVQRGDCRSYALPPLRADTLIFTFELHDCRRDFAATLCAAARAWRNAEEAQRRRRDDAIYLCHAQEVAAAMPQAPQMRYALLLRAEVQACTSHVDAPITMRGAMRVGEAAAAVMPRRERVCRFCATPRSQRAPIDAACRRQRRLSVV